MPGRDPLPDGSGWRWFRGAALGAVVVAAAGVLLSILTASPCPAGEPCLAAPVETLAAGVRRPLTLILGGFVLVALGLLIWADRVLAQLSAPRRRPSGERRPERGA